MASRLGVSLRGLAPVMGLSVASLFGYRNGSIKISNKAWSKLEHIEKAPSDAVHSAKPPEKSGWLKEFREEDEKKSTSILRDDIALYKVRPMAKELQKALPPDADRDVLERIAKALERLVELEEERNLKT